MCCTGPGNQINAVAFTPDGRSVVALTNGDNMARRWDLASGSVQSAAALPSEGRVAFLAPDGQTACMRNNDGTLQVFDLVRGQERFATPNGVFVFSQAYSPAIHSLALFMPDYDVLLDGATSVTAYARRTSARRL